MKHTRLDLSPTFKTRRYVSLIFWVIWEPSQFVLLDWKMILIDTSVNHFIHVQKQKIKQ